MALVLFALGVGWEILDIIDRGNNLIGPIDTFLSIKALVLRDSVLAEHDDSIWSSMSVSLIELLFGILAGGGLATFASALCQKKSSIEPPIRQIFALTHVMLILIPTFILGYFPGKAGIWFSVSVTMTISFFPFFQALLAFKERSWGCRYLLAIEHSLPYAFVGVLLGESIHASRGVGLMMTITSATRQTDNGLAIAILVTSVFVVIDLSIRSVLRRRCLSMGHNTA